MNEKFLQIHFLTSYPAALLNRDDVGFAKRLPFGGATRTRVSSQCLKRHWRTFEGESSLRTLDAPRTIRSRFTFDQYLRQPLEQEGVAPDKTKLVVEAIMAVVLGKSEKSKKKEKENDGGDAPTMQTGQITVLGRPEVDYLLTKARAVCADSDVKDAKTAEKAVKNHLDRDGLRNLKQMGCVSGLDAAMFGRMITSDILARGDAAVHVAHAFTVHAEASESDYFSAVDDLLRTEDRDELGSGHIGTTELTSGLYYGYVAVDVPLLVSNVTGCERNAWTEADRTLPGDVVERLVKLVATVSPGAKLGSTAPHAYAQCILIEAGNAQPRTLANAFMKPVSERPDLLQNAYRALADHLDELDGLYGKTFERRVAGIALRDAFDLLSSREPELVVQPGDGAPALPRLARWAGNHVRGI